jgi:uncharacterized membrane protein
MVISFLVLMFAWYIFTSNSATFNSLVGFVQNLKNQLGDFLNPASRGEDVLRGLGIGTAPSIWNTLSRASAYITEGLIVVGFVGLVSGYTKTRINKEFYILTVVATAFLGALMIVPGLANGLNMTRFYHVMLLFLAPLCVLGAEVFARLALKRENKQAVSILLSIVLVIYFLFQTGFVYEVVGSDTYAFQLSMYRMSDLRLYSVSGYIDTYSAFGAQWLSRSANVQKDIIYSDSASLGMLSLYGMVYAGQISLLSNTTILPSNSIVYLNALTVLHDTMLYGDRSWNSNELDTQYGQLSSIYTNGGSQVYWNSRQPARAPDE